MQSLKQLARKLKQETYTVYLVSLDRRVPSWARLLAAVTVAYAFSPIDLIPDFIPILGYLDDLVIVPFGIWLVLKMVPTEVLAECREKAAAVTDRHPKNWIAAFAIVMVWFLCGIALVFWLRGCLQN